MQLGNATALDNMGSYMPNIISFLSSIFIGSKLFKKFRELYRLQQSEQPQQSQQEEEDQRKVVTDMQQAEHPEQAEQKQRSSFWDYFPSFK